jgi:peptidoglycan/LPS O-acetylase OafA/YrhL
MKLGLGTWRIFLALLVAISHLWAGMIDGPAAYAVWGFFVLSGYLMTLVLTTRYGTAADGIRRFVRNRILRIYPMFIVAGALGVATILALRQEGIDPERLNPQFMLPQSVWEWVGNLGMIPFLPTRGLPVPVAAALFVEVWAYMLMPLFARNRSAAILGLAVTAAANLQYGFNVASFDARYCGFATGLMPFAVGSLACHYRASLQRFVAPRLSVLLWCVHALLWLANVYWPWTYGLLVSIPLSGWVVLSLIGAESGRADKFAGDLSYPIYLLHTTVGAWFLPLFGLGRGFAFFVVAFVVTLIASWGMLVLIDRPIQHLRSPAATGSRVAHAMPVRIAVTAANLTKSTLDGA